MNCNLYPIKFRPHLLSKVWGGHTIQKWYGSLGANEDNVGESWVVSGYGDYVSEVANGHHEGDDLNELLEVYMDDLVGEKIYARFENTFPLLFKFIDAADDLSVQVHPNDAQAEEIEAGLGKAEMWYVMPSDEKASVFYGWKKAEDKPTISRKIEDGSLTDLLSLENVKEGDVAIIEPGTVHALRKGTVVAEIQESSDLTYRLYDYNRPDMSGKLRPLHVDKALKVMNMDRPKQSILRATQKKGVQNLYQSEFFVTNVLDYSQTIERDYSLLDSFVVYLCVSGDAMIQCPEANETENQVYVQVGEAVLIPACLNNVVITPKSTGQVRLLEVYIE